MQGNASSRWIRSAVFIAKAVALAAMLPSLAWSQGGEETAARAAKARATVVDATFRSESLQREMHYRVLLPASYQNTGKHYPTLYLLHGLYGDFKNWSTLTNLARWAEAFELIVAMPDAGNSWYVNSATSESDRFEDYVVKDFIREVDLHYRTIGDRRARAIAGLSMGGYAAMNFSIKHPELFSYTGAISAALDAPAGLEERKPEFREDLQKAFGQHGSVTRQANDIFSSLAKQNNGALPYFYVDCGVDDMFLNVNRSLTEQFQQKKMAYEYHEMPGAHTWEYWDGAIRRFLLVLCSKRFAQTAHELDCSGASGHT